MKGKKRTSKPEMTSVFLIATSERGDRLARARNGRRRQVTTKDRARHHQSPRAQ
jgi:hypothetical protein